MFVKFKNENDFKIKINIGKFTGQNKCPVKIHIFIYLVSLK